MKDINNNIPEDYCSFDVSKLLKEKGFKVLTNSAYNNDYEKGIPLAYSSIVGLDWNYGHSQKGMNRISRPTHNIAIKWIRENYRPDFCINVFPYIYRNKTLYEIRIFGHHFRESQFKTPEKGIDSGILYALKNLI